MSFCFQGGSQCWEVALEAPDESRFFDVSFVNENIGWLSGVNIQGDTNYIARTINGGEDWEFIFFPDPPSSGDELEDCCSIILFVNEQNGFGAHFARTFNKTTDGGESWQKIEIEGLTGASYNNVNDIEFISPDTGWVSIRQNGIFFTTDGGNNWEKQLDWGGYLVMDFVNDQKGWFVSATSIFGQLFSTIDGGYNWDFEFSESGTSFNKIFFIDENHGWLARYSDLIFKTSNGGDTWETIENLTGERFFIKEIFFVNGTMGWMCSRYTKDIQYTIDGGETWQLQSTPDITGFRSMYMTGVDKGWAVTEDGYLLRYNPRPACSGTGEIEVEYSFGDDVWLTPLLPEISWTPMLGIGCIDGYILQLGNFDDITAYLDVDVGMETSYQLTTPLPPDTTRIRVRIVPYNHVYGANPDCQGYGTDFFTTACPSLAEPIDTFICEGEAFYWDGHVFEEPGVFQIPYLNEKDCDSTITLNLQWYEAPMQTVIDTVLVAGESLNGVFYEQDTIFTEFLPAVSGCDSIVIYVINIVTDVNYPDEGPVWELFPNPASDEIFLTGKYGWEWAVLYDVHGRLLRQWQGNNQPGRRRLDVNDLNAGLYFVQIKAAEGIWTQKVFINGGMD